MSPKEQMLFVDKSRAWWNRQRCSQFHGMARIVGAAFCLFLLATPMYSDVSARIAGTVTDPSGALVPGAAVSAVNTQTGVKQETHTDTQGYYSFPSLAVGRYDLEVQANGFKAYKVAGLTLDVNTALTANVSLQLGAANQEVTVDAAAIQVETTSSQMGEVINSTKMTTVPLNGRSYTDLLALQPGVTPVSSGQYSALSVSGDLNPGSLSVSGQRESSNGFMVNGGNVEEGGAMGTAIIPNLDSIAEFRILTNDFDAEYGNYAGGQVNAITKSGTNDFHGDLFEFLRNTDLDARNFYSPTRSSFVQNQFGGTFGGRVIRDKLFFFVDYQGTRQILGQSTGDVLVPSLADRTGNVSDLASQLSGNVNGAYWANQLSQKLGYGVAAGEPYYTPGCASSANCVFPNAVIPQSAISPIAQNELKYIPTPNNGQYFSTSAYNQNLNDNKGSFRIDYNSPIGAIAGYYFIDNYNVVSPYSGGSNVPGFSSVTPGQAQMANIADTKNFGPEVVNEFRIHFMRTTAFLNEAQGGTGVSLSSLGYATGVNSLGIVALTPATEGVPQTGFNNYTIGVTGFSTAQYNNTYQVMDNLSRVLGTHTMKFGGSFHYDQLTEHDFGANNGTFSFSGVETGSDFADFLIGAPSSYAQGVQEPLHLRSHYIGLYGQDSWRVTPKLVLNYGLRWEVTTPWADAFGQLETIVPGQQSAVFPGAPTGWVFPGDKGIPKTLAPVRYNNFAPRIGLAYSPDNSSGLLGKLVGGPGKTSIRASFGVFYTAFEGVTGFNAVGDAPFGYFWVSPTPPLLGTPFVDRSTGNPEGQRFPVAFPPLNVSASNPDNAINWAGFTPISSSPAYGTHNRVPYAEDYSFSLQRQIGQNTILGVSYVGTQAHALLSDLEANVGNPGLCLGLSQTSQVAPTSGTCGPFGENGVYVRSNGQVVNGTRSPLGNAFGSDGYFVTIGNSNYNSLQVTLRHRSGPLELLAGYTWSKSIDDSSGWGDQINPVNYRLSRALSSFDVPQNLVFSYHYDLPFDKLFHPNRLTSGWTISGISRFASGLPIFLTETDDHSLLGTFSTGPNGTQVDTPNYTPGNLNIRDPRSGLSYFNTSLFSQEAIGQLGTANKRFFHGPGLNNSDLALLKDVHLTESKYLQLRFEFFNIFNHAQFINPSGNINSGTFGIVTQARDPRIGQVALKLVF